MRTRRPSVRRPEFSNHAIRDSAIDCGRRIGSYADPDPLVDYMRQKPAVVE